MVSSSPKKDTSLWVKNQGKLTTSNASMALFGHALAVSSDSLTLSPKNSKIISGRSGTLFTPIIDHYSFRTTPILSWLKTTSKKYWQGCLFLMCADEIERIMDREGVFIEG